MENIPTTLHARLSILLLLIYAVPGAWIPMFSLRLERELGFTPFQTACAYTSWPIGAIVASLIAGQIADRWMSIEKCIAVCGLMEGALMLSLSQATAPWAVIGIAIVMCLFLVPTMTLGITYCLAHLPHPERQFGGIRAMGTLGWLMPAIFLYFWFTFPQMSQPVLDLFGGLSSSLADTQRLAGVLGFCLAGYALTLPYTPPVRRMNSEKYGWLAPLAALPLLKRRPFAVLCLCFFLLHVTVAFNFQQVPLLLKELGIEERWILPLLTVGQWSEIVILFLMPVISFRLGTRKTLLLGLAAWAAGFGVLTIGQPAWLVVASLALNGFTICCFLVRGQVFIARQAGEDVRASAQGLVAMMNGIGGLLGNLLVGGTREWVQKDFTLSFGVGAVLTVLTVVLFIAGFREEEEPSNGDLENQKSTIRNRMRCRKTWEDFLRIGPRRL